MLFLKNSPEAQILDLEITFQLLFLMLLTLVTPVTFPLLLGSIFLSILFNFHQSSLQLTLNYSGCPRIVYYLLPNNPASQPESASQWGPGAFQFPPPLVDPRTPEHFPGHPTWQEDPPSYEATLNQEEVTPATSHPGQEEEKEKDTETDPERAPTVTEPLLVDNMQQNSNVLVDNTQETDAQETIYLEEDTIETLPPLIGDTEAAETEKTVGTTAGPGQGRGAPRGRRPPARARHPRPSRPSIK